MYRFLLSLLIIFCMALPSAGSFADDNSPERNAFQFAARKDWGNALAYAHRSSNPALLKLITWEYVLDADSGASFDEITSFINDNPSWPDQKKLHLRAEVALHNHDVADKDIIAWFGDDTPISGMGKIALAEALMRTQSGKTDKIHKLIREAWQGGDFDEPEENKILSSYGSLLTKEDHIARIDRLLWEERLVAAKRVLRHAPEGYQKLFKARIALQENKKLAVISIAQVPSSLKNDSGLIFDRMIYRAHQDDDSGVRDMLLAAPAHPPYADKWWRFREFQVRKAIGERKYALAKKLLINHGQAEGSTLADATWLSGWLKTEFMGEPKSGYNDFTAMYDQVHYPVSKARAAYWAARAAEKFGDSKLAKQWYKTASTFPTAFYGQLGAVKSGATTLDFPDSPVISDSARSKFEKNDLTQAIKLSINMRAFDFAAHLISLVIENTDDEASIAMLSELGTKAGQTHLSVHAAKKAMQQNVVLIDAGYPTPSTPESKPIEPALTLAITRQESEFDPNARSPSGAVGMMQLLPGTAKEIARKHEIGFSSERLTNPEYNMTLGSLYLARLISSYDGSYILAIAAYNAGPGNVHNWVQTFNTPGNNMDAAVDWIEEIPYRETRNYVQRVLENLQVFRHITSEDNSPKLKLAEDLVR